MKTAVHDYRSSRFLAAFEPPDIASWLPALELIDTPFGTFLARPHERQHYAYFPTTAVISLIYPLAEGTSVEVAVIGQEGFLGVPIVLGDASSPNQAMVQIAGQCWRLPARCIEEEMARGGKVMKHMLRFAQALMTQASMTAVCNRHHALDQHLCRWLLLMLDRLEGDRFAMTQEVIATMLGVRRETVTEAAVKLQGVGAISYARGRIQVLDRRRLEAQVCECYVTVQQEYGRLLPELP